MPLARLLLPLLTTLALAASAVPAHAAMTTLPAGFSEVATTGNSFFPVGVAWAPDGRRFVVQKAGALIVWKADGTKATVRDFSAEVNSYSDRGLLGVAVDRDFATNGYVYILYTAELQPLTPDQDGRMVSRLERLTISPANAVSARQVILGTYTGGPCPAPDNAVDCIPSDHGWHSIGTVRVDPVDGTLWVGSGDGHGHHIDADSYRPYDERSFAGKIIHIDRDGRGLAGHPFCPAETDTTKVCAKLYAKGFRNPFRFTLRPGGKGPVVGDVGYGQEEEVDLLEPGRNYGWPCYEGGARTALYDEEPRCVDEYAKEGGTAAATDPVWSYPHEAGASVVGGPALSGSDYPSAWAGDVFVGDYVRGWIKRLELTADDQVAAVHEFASGGSGVVDLQQEPGGDVAYLDLGYESGAPQVRRFDYTPGNAAPVADASATPTSGAAPLEVAFSSTGSSDPDGDLLTYTWDFGDGGAGTGPSPSHTYTESGSRTATLTVSDGQGHTAQDTVAIQVGGNGVPDATISSPADESLYRGGQAVTVSGGGTDTEEGTLPGSSLRWTVILNHAGHTHVAVTGESGTSVSFTPLTDHDADSFYEVTLTATDAAGQEDTHTIQLRPEKRAITLDSSPPGAPLEWAGASVTAPSTRQAAVGYRPTITAAPSFTRNGRTYTFARWSDGGERSHSIDVPAANTTYTAVYDVQGTGLKTLRFPAVADTHVDASSPTHVFGADPEMVADASPVRRALLRFAPQGLAGHTVIGSRLRLYQRDASPAGGIVHPLPDDASWTESEVWPGPSGEGASVGTFGSVSSGRWYELDLAQGTFASDGPRSLVIRSTNTDGSKWGTRESPTPPELILDLAANPETSIDAGPPAATNDATPTFRFSSPTGTSFECRIDGGAWAACPAEHTTATLADGPHVLAVRARTAAGGIDPTPATRAFTVDTSPTQEPSPGTTASPVTTSSPGPAAAPPVQGPSGGGDPVLAPLPDRLAPRVVGGAATFRARTLTRTGRVRLSFGVTEQVAGTVTLRDAAGRRVLGRRTFRAAPGRAALVSVALTRVARRLAARRGRQRIRVHVVVRDAAGNTSRATWRFTLRAPGR